ncbi:M14 family zinc carboxypeptidase [Aestuariibacter salexigens]|uniref:M14 family zinc carboxypeptidase n=1 Tax=Aestuariibacter salexigens TaxID=226010 RepID=UPI000410EC5E|nr:M14 family zinc carboxypeptidase [Aestuariibacter salexigens]
MTIVPVPHLDKLVVQHADLQPHLQALQAAGVSSHNVGQSLLGRDIVALKFGSGPHRVLAWSQMHGDESTATASLIDLATHLQTSPPDWLSQVTLMLVPMLNPDGAQRLSRYNAAGIDINRDALALASPEGKILNDLVSDFAPHWAFNLHDQDRWYRAGIDGLPATLSFLATAADPDRKVGETRSKAMALIGQLLQDMQIEQKVGVGRYSDEYNPRCFGDAIAAKDIAVILVECGFAPDDPARQEARRLTAEWLFFACEKIAIQQLSQDTTCYLSIPMNQDKGCADLVIENVQLAPDVLADVVIRGDKVDPHSDQRVIDDIGDYQHLHAYQRVDAAGMQPIPMLTYWIEQPLFLDDDTYRKLIDMGYIRFAGDRELLEVATFWPVDWRNSRVEPQAALCRGDKATMALGQDESIQLAIICGQVIPL